MLWQCLEATYGFCMTIRRISREQKSRSNRYLACRRCNIPVFFEIFRKITLFQQEAAYIYYRKPYTNPIENTAIYEISTATYAFDFFAYRSDILNSVIPIRTILQKIVYTFVLLVFGAHSSVFDVQTHF